MFSSNFSNQKILVKSICYWITTEYYRKIYKILINIIIYRCIYIRSIHITNGPNIGNLGIFGSSVVR